MAVTNRIFALSIMGSILAFAIIHLGVSIGIIASYRHYGDIFSPQVGLSSFNLVIALLGLVTGILGLAVILMNSEGLGKIYFNSKNFSYINQKLFPLLYFCNIFVFQMIHS